MPSLLTDGFALPRKSLGKGVERMESCDWEGRGLLGGQCAMGRLKGLAPVQIAAAVGEALGPG
jgi:hypothetical protein